MRKDFSKNPPLEPTVENLSKAIFIVNKHAKTALNPKFLYQLKKTALQKMIEKGQAKKMGLHFSRNPKFSQQQSTVVVECGEYNFHIPPTKQDFKELPHLGNLDDVTRNPKTHLSLNLSKSLLMSFTGIKDSNIEQNSMNHRTSYQRPARSTYTQPVFKRLGEY